VGTGVFATLAFKFDGQDLIFQLTPRTMCWFASTVSEGVPAPYFQHSVGPPDGKDTVFPQSKKEDRQSADIDL
jgi:hypothetical protein